MKSHLKGLTFIHCNLSCISFAAQAVPVLCDNLLDIIMLYWEMFLATCFIFNDYIHDIIYFIYLVILFSHFHHSRETGCGGDRTTEKGSKLSAPFYPPMIDNRRQTTAPGTTCPTRYDKCVGSFTSHRIINIEGV